MGQSGALCRIEEDYGANEIVLYSMLKLLLIVGILVSPAIGQEKGDRKKGTDLIFTIFFNAIILLGNSTL